MDKVSTLFKSRKFWAAFTAIALIVVRNFYPNLLPFTDADITAVCITLIGYILGTALEDGLRARAMR